MKCNCNATGPAVSVADVSFGSAEAVAGGPTAKLMPIVMPIARAARATLCGILRKGAVGNRERGRIQVTIEQQSVGTNGDCAAHAVAAVCCGVAVAADGLIVSEI